VPLICKFLDRLYPRPPQLDLHLLQAEPESLLLLADFLERLAQAESWSANFDGDLEEADKRQTLDDWLQNAGIEAAEMYRRTLTGEPEPRMRRKNQRPGLQQQREELHAIAHDLRLDASQ